MKITHTVATKRITFRLEPESAAETKGLGQEGKEINLVACSFRYMFPRAVGPVHPDLIALTVFAVVQPYAKQRISFPLAVTSQFAQALETNFGLKVINVNPRLQPRPAGKHYSLAFSGGVDSLACSLLLPKDTAKFTYLRTNHPDVEPRVDNHTRTVADAVAIYQDTIKVRSDMEYISGPFLQWPTWVALSTPGFLLADKLNLRGIAYGLMEGGPALESDGVRPKQLYFEADWRALYKAVGLEMVLPTCGVTEVGTALITSRQNLLRRSNSCQRGTYEQPCQVCSKCFQKDLVEYAIGQRSTVDIAASLPAYMSSRIINGQLLQAQMPISQQHLYMYGLRGSRGRFNDPILRLFRKKIFHSRAHRNVGWVGEYNRRDLEINTDNKSLFRQIDKKITKAVPLLSAKNKRTLERWNLVGYYAHAAVNRRMEKITRKIEAKVKIRREELKDTMDNNPYW